MSLKSSGLWCDLCRKPILFGDYWCIGWYTDGKNKEGHACQKCKDEYEKKKPEPTKEGE